MINPNPNIPHFLTLTLSRQTQWKMGPTNIRGTVQACASMIQSTTSTYFSQPKMRLKCKQVHFFSWPPLFGGNSMFFTVHNFCTRWVSPTCRRKRQSGGSATNLNFSAGKFVVGWSVGSLLVVMFQPHKATYIR